MRACTSTIRVTWFLQFPGKHICQAFKKCRGFFSHPPSGGKNEGSVDPMLNISNTLAVWMFLDALMLVVVSGY